MPPSARSHLKQVSVTGVLCAGELTEQTPESIVQSYRWPDLVIGRHLLIGR